MVVLLIYGGEYDSDGVLPRFTKNPPRTPVPLDFLTVTALNYRGLATASPYLHKIFESGSDIVILSEHWLWPFDLYKLESLHPSFTAFGCADRRLTETTYDKSKGCGGVGILWRKSMDVFPISDIVSDRICSIRM